MKSSSKLKNISMGKQSKLEQVAKTSRVFNTMRFYLLMYISPFTPSQWCTNPASDVETASLECPFLGLVKSLPGISSLSAPLDASWGQWFSIWSQGFMPGYYIRSKEPTAYLGIGKEKHTSPSLFQRCLALSQSAESTAWSCLENLIRSHSAEHIEFQEAGKLLPLEGVWKMVHVWGEDKN